MTIYRLKFNTNSLCTLLIHRHITIDLSHYLSVTFYKCYNAVDFKNKYCFH